MSTFNLWLSVLCAFGVSASRVQDTGQCMDGITVNVILLEDEESPWSLKYVGGQILEAIEKDAAINAEEGNSKKRTIENL